MTEEKTCYNCGNKNCNVYYSMPKKDYKSHFETYEYRNFDCVNHDKWEELKVEEIRTDNKKTKKNALERIAELEKEFGFFHNSQASFYFEGQDGMAKMAGMMDSLSKNPPKEVAGLRVVQVGDYRTSTMLDTATGETSKIELPRASVLYFGLGNGNSVIVRPSGTEPKCKFYFCIRGKDKAETTVKMAACKKYFGVL